MVQEAAESWTRLNVHAHTHTHTLIDKFMNNSTRQFPFLDFFLSFSADFSQMQYFFPRNLFLCPSN